MMPNPSRPNSIHEKLKMMDFMMGHGGMPYGYNMMMNPLMNPAGAAAYTMGHSMGQAQA